LKEAGLARYTWLSQSTGWQGSQNYQDWDIRQGPLVAQPPFQFDEDIAKDDFGAFRVSFEVRADSFAANLDAEKVTKLVARKRVRRQTPHLTTERRKT